MEKRQLSELKYKKIPIGVGTRSKVYLLSNGKILKLYDEGYLEYEKLFCVGKRHWEMGK